MMVDYFVYILGNKSWMLYVGVTNNLERRLFEHRGQFVPGFAERYGLTRLVYYESTGDVKAAISREKEIKGWVRRKKVALIHSFNPEWKDLSVEWMPPDPDTLRFAQGDRKQDKTCMNDKVKDIRICHSEERSDEESRRGEVRF